MRTTSRRTRQGAGAVVASVTLLGAVGILAAGTAAAAPNYASAANLTSTGPSVFSASPSDQQVAALKLTEVVAGGLDATAPDNYVCVALSGGASFANTASQTPSVTSSANNVGPATVAGGDLVFPVTAASSAPATYSLSNLYVTGTAGAHGPVIATVTEGENSSCSATTGTYTLSSKASVYGVETFTQNNYGQSADATAANEFSSQVNCGDAHPAQNTAVIATNLDPYDALSAATLEGALNATGSPAGLLITPQGAPGSELMNALKADGVGTVYIVGGQYAISAQVIAALKSTPATTCNGTSAIATSSNLKVIGPIAGQTADDTAAAIDTQANSILALNHNLPAPATSENDTAGNTAGTWTSGAPTAILVADNDWSDAMAVAGVAYQFQIPVVLTPGNSLGSAASTELSNLHVKNVLALGGQLALQNTVVNQLAASGYAVARIAGQDATDTAQLLSRYELAASSAGGLGWSSTSHTALLAQGAYWSDALGAAVISANESAPILLTEGPTKGLGNYTPGGLSAASSSVYNLQVLGGPFAVPQSQISAALTALASTS